VNGYLCTCASGYSGIRCGTNLNECASNPCLNGGTCVDGDNSFTCTCAGVWSGPQCDRTGGYFQYYRWIITAARSTTEGGVAASALAFYAGGVVFSPATMTATSTGTTGPVEGPENLFDGLANTKFYDSTFVADGNTVTVVVDWGAGMQLDYYTVCTSVRGAVQRCESAVCAFASRRCPPLFLRLTNLHACLCACSFPCVSARLVCR
jgi:hypothetical protein